MPLKSVASYLVVGNGRMSKHLCYYFDCLGIQYQQWNRVEYSEVDLDRYLSKATHVLLLINDSAIEPFIQHTKLTEYPHITKIHFSGSLTTPDAFGVHPLQTFGKDLYSVNEYQRIPFIVEQGAPLFSELLPGLNNPHYQIAQQEKPYYHALCVLANNVTTLIWQKFYREMEERFGFAAKDLNPFLIRTLKNIESNPMTALTGPIARRDMPTLEKDLAALEGDQFYSVFQAIINQFAVGDFDENCA